MGGGTGELSSYGLQACGWGTNGLARGVDGEDCMGLQGPVPKVWGKQEWRQGRKRAIPSWATVYQNLKAEGMSWGQEIREESS